MMNRARAILVMVIPALVLLACVDWFTDSLSSPQCDGASCLHSTDGHSGPSQGSPDSSFDQALRHSSRRSNLQTGDDGFSVVLAVAGRVLPERGFQCLKSPIVDSGLA